MKKDIKLSLYVVNCTTGPYFRGERRPHRPIESKHGGAFKKPRCAVFCEGVNLAAIGMIGDRSVPVPVDQFKSRGVSHMKKSITLSLVLAASMGLAACGEKAADDTAATTEDAATVEGAADGAMEAAEGAADAAAAADGAADAAAAGDAATATDKAAEASAAAQEAADAAKGAMEEAKK
ncbi:MAG: hypothetical protein ACT6Q5_06375 [Sphingopyxis solisilvae]|uniref:hypothetical protein n=1 Tax=Sphingopyxis solisilvae TaxID=1886788 RepID=UPI004036EABA